MKPIWCNLCGNCQKIQGLHGAFLRLENRCICRVSNACIQRIQYKLSATFSDKYRQPNLRVILDDVIPWINKASLALYIARRQRAMARPIRMFRSCMALSSSSPVIENCQCRDREMVSDAISAIEVPTSRQCTHYMYVDDLLPYEPLCSYWARGQVFIFSNDQQVYVLFPTQYGVQYTQHNIMLHHTKTIVVCAYEQEVTGSDSA